MIGIDLSFDECLKSAKLSQVGAVRVPVLHLNHLIANKKAVDQPKDKLDVFYLENIKKLREEI